MTYFNDIDNQPFDFDELDEQNEEDFDPNSVDYLILKEMVEDMGNLLQTEIDRITGQRDAKRYYVDLLLKEPPLIVPVPDKKGIYRFSDYANKKTLEDRLGEFTPTSCLVLLGLNFIVKQNGKPYTNLKKVYDRLDEKYLNTHNTKPNT